jgi:hypothetical protein
VGDLVESELPLNFKEMAWPWPDDRDSRSSKELWVMSGGHALHPQKQDVYPLKVSSLSLSLNKRLRNRFSFTVWNCPIDESFSLSSRIRQAKERLNKREHDHEQHWRDWEKRLTGFYVNYFELTGLILCDSLKTLSNREKGYWNLFHSHRVVLRPLKSIPSLHDSL